MSIETWIIVGLLAGFVASKFILRAGEGLMRDLGLGIGGAVIGGWIFGALRAPGATGVDVFGLVVVLAGASAMLILFHTLFSRFHRG